MLNMCKIISIKKSSMGIVLIALVLLSSPQTSVADTPAAGIAVAFAVGVVSGIAANAVYDYASSDTTTTTTTTESDGEGNTTTTTTTTTEKSTAAPETPVTPHFVNINGTAVKKITTNNVFGQMIGATRSAADVLLTRNKISSITYKVERSIRTLFKRKVSFPKTDVKVPLIIRLNDLFVSTKDIPKTNGKSALKVMVSVNGKVLYTFRAHVSQGKIPKFSDPKAKKSVIKKGVDILAINGFKKYITFNAELGKDSDEIIVTILSKGTGERI